MRALVQIVCGLQYPVEPIELAFQRHGLAVENDAPGGAPAALRDAWVLTGSPEAFTAWALSVDFDPSFVVLPLT